MTQRTQELLREALALPVDERADVAAQLLASLNDEDVATEDIEAAWAAEIEKRARRVLSGQSEGIPWEDVRRRAEVSTSATQSTSTSRRSLSELRAIGAW